MKIADALVQCYEDGAGWPNPSREKEQAFRQGFVESARHIVRHWVGCLPREEPEARPRSIAELLAVRTCDPDEELKAAAKLRQRVQERFSVYSRGRKRLLGFRSGHARAAARLRGRHHAMVYIFEPEQHLETCEVDLFDPQLLCPWLRAVERWAQSPIRPKAPAPPPRPLEVAQAEKLTIAGFEGDEDEEEEDEEQVASPPICPPVKQPTQAPASRLPLVRADAIELRPPAWLLRGILERDTFALVFGDPGCGKSFLAIDWACRVATATPWRGEPVSGGPVVYVAGEGRQGLGRRIAAWSEHHEVPLHGAPLYVAPSVAIPNPTDLVSFAKAIDEVVGHPAMIVLDTLARCFGGGDENSTQDMSRFIASCDALRRRYASTLLVVHHTGHADKSRARGAIALKAALDAEYRLAQECNLLLTATKMKDAELPAPLAMELVSVPVPGLLDDYGSAVTSAAIRVLDANIGILLRNANESPRRGRWRKAGLEVARQLAMDSEDKRASIRDWHSRCKAMGMRQSTRYDVLAKLQSEREILVEGESMIPV